MIYENLKVLLLSAGYGTRLGALTKDKPKCLMQIGGTPILGIWIKKLESLNCKEIIINTHYLSNQVVQYINNFKTKIKIHIEFEEELLGTAGTLLKNSNYFKDSQCLMIHADNYTNLNFNDFFKSHQNKQKQCLLSMVTFKSNNPKSCGILETDDKGIMINFEEKPSNPKTDIANGAIYIFDNNLLEYLKMINKSKLLKDFSNDVIPLLKNRINTWHTNDYIIDIGTLENLKIAMQLHN